MGRYEESIAEIGKGIQIDPDFDAFYAQLPASYQYLDRPRDAQAVLERAAARKLDNPDLQVARYDLAFLRGDSTERERLVAMTQGKRGTEDYLCNHESVVLAYSGRLREALRKSQRAVDLASQAGQAERAALYQVPVALWEAFFGDAPGARRGAAAALRLSQQLYVEYGAAFALALAGDSLCAQTLANDIEKRFGEDTSVRTSYLPALRARLALNHGEPEKGIELLQTAIPCELGVPRSAIHGNFGALYPVYVRGQAYLAERRGAEAAAEFRKILDHREIVFADPIGALARLEQGRAFALLEDRAKAKSAYRDFLSLWKDADPDLPVLKQAKAEYARLSR